VLDLRGLSRSVDSREGNHERARGNGLRVGFVGNHLLENSVFMDEWMMMMMNFRAAAPDFSQPSRQLHRRLFRLPPANPV
jgi:hypothetical protein